MHALNHPRLRTLAALTFITASSCGPSWAIREENEFVNDFGMVAIAAGQTARLNVLNAIGDPGIQPCTVELRFFDGRGQLLGGPDTKVLGAREAAFLDLALGPTAARGTRLQLHAQVSARFANPREQRACSNNLMPTLEVFDTATGQTQFLHPGVIKGFNPQPDPPGTPASGK